MPPLSAPPPRPTPQSPDEWLGAEGTRYAYDGVFHSFVNEEGQGIKLWLPPGDRPARGVLLFGNPGVGLGGDTRDKTRQRDLLEFASWHDFGVAGVTGFPATQTFAEPRLGRHVLAAFAEWGRRGHRPELAHIPFLFSGPSNGGGFSFAMMMFAPSRTIAITPNVGPRYAGRIDALTRAVPAWMHVGAIDPIFPDGVEITEQLFAEHGPQGALWAWEAEIKGHANGASDHVDMAYWDAIIPLRVPASVQPGEPVVLRTLDRARGWWTDSRTWDHALAQVGPMPAPAAGEPGRYGWMPDERTARLYQAAATRARPLMLTIESDETTAGGATEGILLSAGGSALASVGERVKLRVTLAPLLKLAAPIVIHDGANQVAEVDPDSLTAVVTIPAGRPVLALHARTQSIKRTSDGLSPRISNPVQIVVRNPAATRLIDEQLARVTFPANLRTEAPPATAPVTPSSAPAIPAKAIPANSAEPRHAPRANAAFWTGADAPLAVPFASAGPGDAVTVQAAYSPQGLCLRFHVRSTRADAAQPPKIEFHLASLLRHELTTDPATTLHHAHPRVNALLRRTHLFAFELDDTAAAPASIQLTRWAPWDWVPATLFADGNTHTYGGAGIRCDVAKSGYGERFAALFLPWSVVGNPGFSSAPPAGTGLSVVFGLTQKTTLETRVFWPADKNPWLTPPASDVYGQILLLPAGR